jgi:hypothetical protein
MTIYRLAHMTAEGLEYWRSKDQPDQIRIWPVAMSDPTSPLYGETIYATSAGITLEGPAHQQALQDGLEFPAGPQGHYHPTPAALPGGEGGGEKEERNMERSLGTHVERAIRDSLPGQANRGLRASIRRLLRQGLSPLVLRRSVALTSQEQAAVAAIDHVARRALVLTD